MNDKFVAVGLGLDLVRIVNVLFNELCNYWCRQ